MAYHNSNVMETIYEEASTLGLRGWPMLFHHDGENFRLVHIERDNEGDVTVVHYISRTRKLQVFND